MKYMALSAAALACVVVATSGCALDGSHPPQTPDELRHQQESRNQEFTVRSTALYNLNRVTNGSLPVEKRTDSLRVLEALRASNVEIYPTLAMVLSDVRSPVPLRKEILAFLIRSDYPGLGRDLARALPTANDGELRATITDWLARHSGDNKPPAMTPPTHGRAQRIP